MLVLLCTYCIVAGGMLSARLKSITHELLVDVVRRRACVSVRLQSDPRTGSGCPGYVRVTLKKIKKNALTVYDQSMCCLTATQT